MAKIGAYPIVGPVVAYVYAVVSAALAFVLISTSYGMIFQGALSTVYPVSERIYQMTIMAVLDFLILTLVIFFTAIIPVVIVHQIAKRFSIKSLWYYVICGALTGLALSPVAIVIMPRSFMEPPEMPPLWIGALYFARFSVPSGAIGGFTYWIVTGRFVKRAYWMG